MKAGSEDSSPGTRCGARDLFGSVTVLLRPVEEGLYPELDQLLAVAPHSPLGALLQEVHASRGVRHLFS